MELIRRFSEPPRLRTLGEDEPCHATWLELFFDLVFVAAVAQVATVAPLRRSLRQRYASSSSAASPSPSWCGRGPGSPSTRTASTATTSSYRLLVFAAMLGVAALATTLPDAFAGASRGFVLSYVFVRVVLLALYARAIRHVQEGREDRRLLLRRLCWSRGCLARLAALRGARALLARGARARHRGRRADGGVAADLGAPVDPRHAPERLGLLTIIVLGESVFAVVLAVTNVNWSSDAVLAALGGFLCAAAFWWIISSS